MNSYSIEILNFLISGKEIEMRIPDLKIESGGFYALIAKSGAGKSVFLSILTGHLLHPWMQKNSSLQFDSFQIGNTDLEKKDFTSFARLRHLLDNEQLIYLPQNFSKDHSLNRSCISEMIDVITAICKKDDRVLAEKKFKEKCTEVGLDNILVQPLNSVSGGERKRLEIIARLVGIELQLQDTHIQNVIFLLDEPTTGLDYSSQRKYLNFLHEMKNYFDKFTITYVIATHGLSFLSEKNKEKFNIFNNVIYIEKKENENGKKLCSVEYVGNTIEFLKSPYFKEVSGSDNTDNNFQDKIDFDSSNSSQHKANSINNNFKIKNYSKLSNFTIEIYRAIGKQFVGREKKMLFTIPLIVGFVVFMAFLARKEPNPERFVFFSTIYAFWVGLFNSCQIVNGAVSSGEWNYWVLSLRRSFQGYIIANSIISLFRSFLQIILFILIVSILSKFYGHDSLFFTFIGQSQLPSYFFQNILHIPPILLIFLLFFTSMSVATISGTCIGTFVSCIAKDTLGSLQISVGIVVVAMVTSSLVLKSDSKTLPVSPPVYSKIMSPAPFLSSPAVLVANKSERAGLKFDYNAGFYPHLLEDASFFLPQRYFYNLANLLNRKTFEYVENMNNVNPTFEYKLIYSEENLKNNLSWKDKNFPKEWSNWWELRNENLLDRKIKELSESGESLQPYKFFKYIFIIIGLETIICLSLSLVYFILGIFLTYSNHKNYVLH